MTGQTGQRKTGVTKHQATLTALLVDPNGGETGRFAPLSFCPIGRIQRFLLIQLKPKHAFQ